jgi:hydrogenase-4 component F
MVILLVMMLVMGTHIPQPVSKMLANASAIVMSGNDEQSTQFSWLWASFDTTAATATPARVQGELK